MGKRLINIAILSILCCMLPFCAKASDSTDEYTVTVQKTELTDGSDELDRIGTRKPAKQIIVVISQSRGLEISSINKESIIRYEILDKFGNTINMFDEEVDFVSTFFSLHGDIEIKLYTEDFLLRGYLCIQ